jgi:asparagine synthase (glutamine-hydrolysing)
MALMAGLLTFVSARSGAVGREEAIAAALDKLRHRGGELTVTATRDVVFAGEPLSFPETGRYVIVFDGAIANAEALREELRDERAVRFASDRDVEVIGAAYHHWGPSAVNRLRGMFALVIWDSAARRAFGARDPFGITPLYYLATPGGVYFASEKKPLLELADGPGLDEANLQHYLTLQHVPEPGTMHRGIVRLGAGESFVYTPGGPVANRRYAQLSFQPAAATGAAAGADRILPALRQSVRARLPVDEPVGVLLSSGVDSAAIAALAREASPDVHAYTVGYDGVPAGGSELDVAEQLARHLDIAFTPSVVRAQDVAEALPRMMWHLEDPLADPMIVTTYFAAQAAARDVAVALSGDGADELFGGYGIYREPLSLHTVSHLPDPMQRGLRAMSRVIPPGVRGKSFLERGTTPIEERYYGVSRIFAEDDKVSLLRKYDRNVRHTDITGPVYAEAGGLDEVTTMQHVDVRTWLRGGVLVRADRMAMANSVQLRLPYLDRAVFDVAAGLPAELKVPAKTHETKVALRRAVSGLVPDKIAQRKVAFPVPIGVWLRHDLYDWAHDLLDRSHVEELLDVDLVRGLLTAYRKKDSDHGGHPARQIWVVLMFCLWHAIFVAKTVTVR